MSTPQLDERQTADFGRKMQARYLTLKQEAATALKEAGDPEYAVLSEQVHDLQEQAVADVVEDLRLADARRDLEEMRDIEQALARMHMGTYGKCATCGQPIALARLKAYPTAKRCRTCQEEYERQRGDTQRPRL